MCTVKMWKMWVYYHCMLKQEDTEEYLKMNFVNTVNIVS